MPPKRKQAQTKPKISVDDNDIPENPVQRVQSPGLSINTILIQSSMMLIGVLIYQQFFTSDGTFASAKSVVERSTMELTCSRDYRVEGENYPGCTPKRCARVVMDTNITREEAQYMLKIAKQGLSLGGGSGGASILDLHSGALSKGDKFVNIFGMMEDDGVAVFSEDDFKVYRIVKNKIKRMICEEFNISPKKLFLTKPTFFSRMDTKPARTIHDEYWHTHVDKETYGSFDYTSLLYLSDFGQDFTGGKFVFVDKQSNFTVEPKLGRLLFFTSGSENSHYVEKVETGVRYAVTISFTCDPDKAIADPSLQVKKPN